MAKKFFTDDSLATLVDETKAYTDNAISNHNHIYYGVCSTAAATAAKTVTVDNFSLVTGAMVIVKFTNANSVASPTLNVNSTGAKPICRYGTTASSTGTTTTGWRAGAVQIFVYDGTSWVRDFWENTTYSNVSLGQGYATCTTAEATTAKVGTLSSYALATGGIVSVKFTYAVPASATLNINGKGAKAIYYRGAAITAGVIKAGDVATFIYSSQYHLISIDRWQNDLNSIQTQLDTKVDKVDGKGLSTNDYTTTEKSKLAGIATNANNYSLPTASSSTLGGVKTTSTVTSTSGLTACPIISGVPYYKDTNTTYSLSSFGVTATATELNVLDGITATVTELNYMDGVTSSVQTQLDNKQATVTGGASTITSSNLTVSRALVSNSSGKVAVSEVTSTELGYLDGVTSAIQTQLDGKAASSHKHAILDVTNLQTELNSIKSDLTEKPPTNHADSDTKYGLGNATVYGHVKLSDSTSSTSSTNAGIAATPAAVKAAYDKANHSHPYLSTSGGTISGVITTTDGGAFNSDVTTSGTFYYGGTNFNDGAFLGLYGKDQSNYAGQFRLKADDGENFVYLEGMPSGQLKWNNKTVATLGTNSALAIADGGTGMRSDPSMLVNLASTSAAGVFATSPRPGVTGTLPIANGGTGATTAEAALQELGIVAKIGETINLNYNQCYSGYISSDTRMVTFSVPLPKLLPSNINSITINSISVNIRKVEGGYIGSADSFVSGGEEYVGNSNYTVSYETSKSRHMLTFSIINNVTTFDTTNNTPVSVVGTLKFTIN